MTVSLIISDDVLHEAHLTAEQMRIELAVMLFEKRKLTLGRAADLASMSQREFQHLLGARQIPSHYGVEDFRKDLETLDLLGIR